MPCQSEDTSFRTRLLLAAKNRALFSNFAIFWRFSKFLPILRRSEIELSVHVKTVEISRGTLSGAISGRYPAPRIQHITEAKDIPRLSNGLVLNIGCSPPHRLLSCQHSQSSQRLFDGSIRRASVCDCASKARPELAKAIVAEEQSLGRISSEP
jgi:hypothetical protein